MNKVEYFLDCEKLYLSYLPITELQNKWDYLRSSFNVLQQFPDNIKEIITGTFPKLVEWYFAYLHIDYIEKIKFSLKLQEIFNYKIYYPQIIKFFSDNISRLKIYSCYYCDISIATEYNKTGKRFSLDLDHFLPKAECPLLALSLKNFVPSCQTCNSRIKSRTGLLKFYRIENFSEDKQIYILNRLSPTSDLYQFKDKTFFYIVFKRGYLNSFSYIDNLDFYSIKLATDRIYKFEKNAFLYEQRYNSIPVLSKALSLLDLKRKYPLSKINEIKNVLNQSGKFKTSVQEIEEIIFRKNYDDKNHSNLSKLKNDILDV